MDIPAKFDSGFKGCQCLMIVVELHNLSVPHEVRYLSPKIGLMARFETWVYLKIFSAGFYSMQLLRHFHLVNLGSITGVLVG